MGIFSGVGRAVVHNTWEVTQGDAQKLVAKSVEKSVNHNYSNAANWQGNMSNNRAFTGMRERFLSEPNSPRASLSKDGNLSTITETQQGVGNRYAAHRGNLRQAQANMKANLADLQGAMTTVQKSGDAEAIAAYQAAISGQRKDMMRASTAEIASYGKQAFAHARRAVAWSQEGSMGDRVKKTAALAAGYGGANMAGRMASGGGMTYNNDGERDIAGIPFL